MYWSKNVGAPFKLSHILLCIIGSRYNWPISIRILILLTIDETPFQEYVWLNTHFTICKTICLAFIVRIDTFYQIIWNCFKFEFLDQVKNIFRWFCFYEINTEVHGINSRTTKHRNVIWTIMQNNQQNLVLHKTWNPYFFAFP